MSLLLGAGTPAARDRAEHPTRGLALGGGVVGAVLRDHAGATSAILRTRHRGERLDEHEH